MRKTEMHILLIGIGNPLRGDDGIGAFLCEKMEALRITGLQTLTVQQLTPDLLEEMMRADFTVLADAAVSVTGVEFRPVQEENLPGVSSSHHASAEQLFQMAKLIYGKTLSLHICALGAVQFELGAPLSPEAKKNAGQAVSILLEWINGL